MRKKRVRVFSREFKEAAVRRMLAGEKVQALARELRVWPKLLYAWCARYERGGPEALLAPGRPRKAATWAARREPGPTPPGGKGEAQASARLVELERKVGQQALELDFFKQALRHVKASPLPNAGRGARASSPSSRR